MHCKMARFIGLWSLIFNISLVSLSVFFVCRCQSAFMHSHFMYHPHRVDRTVNGVRSALTWPFFKENFYALTKREENTAQISFALSLSQSVCVVYCLGELNNFNTVDCFVKVRSKIDHFFRQFCFQMKSGWKSKKANTIQSNNFSNNDNNSIVFTLLSVTSLYKGSLGVFFCCYADHSLLQNKFT